MPDAAGMKLSKDLQVILTVKSITCYLTRKHSKMRNMKKE
jgi:hypothetical protein